MPQAGSRSRSQRDEPRPIELLAGPHLARVRFHGTAQDYHARHALRPLRQGRATFSGGSTAFMDEHVYPNEATFHRQIADGDRWQPTAIVEELKPKARAAGLWNLFLPESEYGAGLTNVEYAPLCEIMGRVAGFAPGSLQLLGARHRQHGSAGPLRHARRSASSGSSRCSPAEIRSCFAMTEPDVASSDATNIQSRIERDGDDYVINGRKWWISGAGDPRCRIAIFMGKSDPARRAAPAAVDDPRADGRAGRDDPAHAAGLRLRRCAARPRGDHVRGRARAGVEHAARRRPRLRDRAGTARARAASTTACGSIGVAERALEAMCRRVQTRVAFGKTLAEQGTIRADIAESRMEIEQARLLTMKAAHLMDTVGNKAARGEIAMIKVVVPRMALRVLDRAIQAHGAAGVCDDFPLASTWAHTRTIRLADGPDEVHREAIAKLELKQQSQ